MRRSLRMTLESLSLDAYGTKTRYKKIMDRDGVVSDMEELMDDGTIRKYVGIKYPNTDEIISIMNDVVSVREKQLAEDKAKLEAEQQPFKDIPAPELKPFNAEVTATAGLQDEHKETT